jgi:hypothetical protein
MNSSFLFITYHPFTKSHHNFVILSIFEKGDRDSPVGMANRYGLDGPGIESRWGARFFASIQTDPGTLPASCALDTGSFPEVKRPGRDIDPLSHLSPRLKKE